MCSVVVLVEGESDRVAVEAMARRLGRDLAADGVSVRAIGGATNARRVLTALGADVAVAGLCDEAEEGFIRRALDAAGRGAGPTRAELASRGFFVCVRDLEDELLRALGVPAVEAVVAGQGETTSLGILRRQPAQRGRPAQDQLRRFMGSQSGRKVRYARALVEALDLDRSPAPLRGLLEHVEPARRVAP